MNIYREAYLNIKKYPTQFWMIILASFINQAGNMAFVFLVLFIHEYLKLTLTQGTIAFAVVSGFMLISGMIAGPIIDKISSTKTMRISLLLNCLTLLLIGNTENYYCLLLLCALWGFAFGLYRPATQTLISYFSQSGLHKLTFSIYRLATNLGMSIGPLIGGYIALYSYKYLFFINGIANAVALLILLFSLRQPKWISCQLEEKIKFNIFTEIKLHKNLLFFLLGMFFISMIFFQHESTLGIYLIQDLKFSTNVYGLLFTLNTIMIVALELLLNVATANWPYRVNFMLGGLFIGAGLFGFYFAVTLHQVIFLAMLWTIGEMISFPAASSFISDLAPVSKRASYMSFYNTSLNLGMLIGPWLGSIIMEHISGHALWLMCGVGGILAIAAFYCMKETG